MRNAGNQPIEDSNPWMSFPVQWRAHRRVSASPGSENDHSPKSAVKAAGRMRIVVRGASLRTARAQVPAGCYRSSGVRLVQPQSGAVVSAVC